MSRLRKTIAKRPRLTGWAIAALLLVSVVYYLSPQQLPVVLHKLSIVTLSGVLGYWLHRHAFPQEVHKLVEAATQDPRAVPLAAAAMISRALVILGTMIAAGVAL